MNSYKVIDLATWPRRDSFNFYRTFENPAYSITVHHKITPLYNWAKEHKESFFLLTLYAILRGANRVPQMRQRLVGEQILEFEQLAVMTPIMTQHEEFRQVWCEYAADFPSFRDMAAPQIDAAKAGLPGSLTDHDQDYICASCIPWLHFSGGTQADLGFKTDVPILAWGKMEDGRVPITTRFDHCFVDGIHFSRFYNTIQESFLDPESLYQE